MSGLEVLCCPTSWHSSPTGHLTGEETSRQHCQRLPSQSSDVHLEEVRSLQPPEPTLRLSWYHKVIFAQSWFVFMRIYAVALQAFCLLWLMGGARNLKLGGEGNVGARARAQRAIVDLIYLLCAKRRSNVVINSNVQHCNMGGQGTNHPWSWNTFGFWTFNESRKFACFLILLNVKNTDICVVLQKWRLISHTCVWCMAARGHFITIRISPRGRGLEPGARAQDGSCPLSLPLFWRRPCCDCKQVSSSAFYFELKHYYAIH